MLHDGTLIDQRLYDAAGNVIQSGPDGTLAQGYANALNQGSAQSQLTGNEIHRNRYDDQGRLIEQDILKPDWARSDNAHASDYYRKAKVTYRYDEAGNLKQYLLHNEDGNDYTNTYAYSYAGTESGYRQSQAAGTSRGTSRDTNFKPGTTVNQYDLNGNLILVDATGTDNDRRLVNDAAGHALWANQATDSQQSDHVQRQLVVNGEVLGAYGTGIDPVTPRNGDSSPNFSPQADFNFSWQQLTGASPTPQTGRYSVRQGDTLKGIAQGAYGDSQLWYLIAEANGLGSDQDLKVGQSLTIPSKVASSHNNEQTVKPYDPSRITGDTTPNLAPASNGKGCGGLGTILLIVVAIAVTALTYGTLTTALGPVWGAAAAAASGAVASQAVGNAVGILHGFDWKAVALAAIGGAIGGELAGVNPLGEAASSTANAAARAAIGNALSQGVGVATGLQQRFDWKGVAASAVGAGIGDALSDTAMGDDEGNLMPAIDGQQPRWAGTGPLASLAGQGAWGQFAARSLTGLAAGATAAVARGGRISAQSIAADAFGSALGESLADVMQPEPVAGSYLKLKPGTAENWGPQYSFDDVALPTDYSWAGTGPNRLGGGSVPAQPAVIEDSKFRREQLARIVRLANEPDALGSAGTPFRVEITGVGSTNPDDYNAQVVWLANKRGDDLAPTVANAEWLRLAPLDGARSSSPGAMGYVGGAAEMLLGGVYNQVVRIGGGLASIPYAVFDGADAAVAIQDATRANLGYTLKSDGAAAILGHLAPVVSYVQDNVINPTRAFSETHLGDGMTTVLGSGLQAGVEIYGTATGIRAAGSFATAALDASSLGPLVGSRAAQRGGINLGSPRYQPGVATFGDDLVPASGNWLSAATPTPIPLQVAQALDGQSFKTFGDLRSAVWRTMAADEDLSASFRLKSFTELQGGRAPFAPPAFQNEQFGLKFNLHHVDSIAAGGGVYDLSNLRIVSPTVHALLHGD